MLHPRLRLFAAVVGALVLCAWAMPAAAHNGFHVGETAFDFTLDDIDGVPVSLYDFMGVPIVISFFATWCPGCNEEAASLEADIWQAYQDYNVMVLAIDMQEALPIVQAWVAAQGVTYRVVMSPDWDVFAEFPFAGGLPYNAVIDENMILRYGSVFYDKDAITSELNTILGLTVDVDDTSWGQVKSLFR